MQSQNNLRRHVRGNRTSGEAPPKHLLPCRKRMRNEVHDESECPYAHNIHTCEICKVPLTTENAIISHYKGRKHRIQVALSKNVDVDSGTFYCALCRLEYHTNEGLRQHYRTKWHRKKQVVANFEMLREKEEENKNGVELTSNEELDFGVLDESSGFQNKIITIRNISPSEFVTLLSVKPKKASRFQDEIYVVSARLCLIPANGSTVAVVMCLPKHVGVFLRTIEFTFSDKHQNLFTISRTVKVAIGDRGALEDLLPKTPYKAPSRKLQPSLDSAGKIVKGVPTVPSKYVTKIGYYNIPKELQNYILGGTNVANSFKTFCAKFVPKITDMFSFTEFMDTLLWIEESQMLVDIRRYDLHDVELRLANRGHGRRGALKRYALEVPGLAEKRPSILYGDKVKVKGKGSNTVYHGYAASIELTNVILQFSHEFDYMFMEGMKFDVEFTFSRAPLRRMHDGCQSFSYAKLISYNLHKFSKANLLTSEDLKDYFLSDLIRHFESYDPNYVKRKVDETRRELKFYNKQIEKNFEQQQAVANIKLGLFKPLPFIVFGPPGTGKTNTVVEAIIQIAKSDAKSKILVCCPSNSACDVVLERLASQFSTRELFRLNALSRSNYPPLSDSVTRHSNYNPEKGFFDLPTVDQLKSYKIIVATCLSAGQPRGVGLSKDHFTHVFIDEAGQALEHEIAVPLGNVSQDVQIVLAGDHKQLGPIIRSVLAKHLDLHVSFLEKWMNLLLFFLSTPDQSTSNGLVKAVTSAVPNIRSIVSLLYTKLVNNYRSHPSILKLPNRMFYQNELVPKADPAVVDQYLEWDELPTAGFPIMIVHVEGADMREGNSPSWFNPTEVLQVRKMIDILKSDRRYRCTDSDIGVITPYHRQVQKIQNVLRPSSPMVKVGSVETFQGQERKIIIISTVRSSPEYISMDKSFHLGFLAEPKRFNVAVTRAKALLVVIGNANILWMDDCWRELIQLAWENNAVKNWDGPPKIPGVDNAETDEMTMLSSLLESVQLSGSPSKKLGRGRLNQAGSTVSSNSVQSGAIQINTIRHTSTAKVETNASDEEEDDFEIIVYEGSMQNANDVEWVERE
ncbi:P-loop containing nucleoside triphosphate hydrolase protein [Paraphysoderma sedebokerense]|nr:P-loop containing nucleoside triphosphate hydrolase protein [Paraphysoderma sedebokerense]